LNKTIAVTSSVGASVRIIQFTDPHLHESVDGTLLGLNTHQSLTRVIEQAAKEVPLPDAILATGDISQDYSPASYQRFHQWMESFECPFRWCPGNHDKKELMVATAQKSGASKHTLELGNWLILLLDTAVPGKVPGHLADDQLELAAETFHKYPDHYILVAFHHQPVPMGSKWIDEQKVANGDALVALAQQFPQVRGLLWGHVHQERHDQLGTLQLISTPSTSIQFKPKEDEFTLDTLAPGYRVLDLHDDGSITTWVSRVEVMNFDIDFSVKGY